MIDIVVYDALACNSVWINHYITNKIAPVVHVKENNISSIKEMPEKELIRLIQKDMYTYKERLVFNTC